MRLAMLLIFLLLLPASQAHRYFGQGYFGMGNFGTNTDPSIDAFQPSDLNFSANSGITFIFNVTSSDADTDKLTLNWTINGTYIMSSQNLSYTFNTAGTFNITANISDNLSHMFVSWIVTINPAAAPVPSEGVPGGAAVSGGAAVPTYAEQQAQFEQELLARMCPSNETFINRLTSKCKIPENLICEDGENFILDRDCKVSLGGLRAGDLFRNMWFLRFVLFFSIFLLTRNSKAYPLVTIMLVSLFIYNGAFIRPGTEFDRMACMDVNFLINAGYCIMPDKPVLGWLIAFTMVITVISYFVEITRSKKAKKEKKKPQAKKKQSPETSVITFILVLMLVYAWAVMNAGINISNSKCTDIGLFINFGECITPTRPIVGWIIGITLIVLALGYFFKQARKEQKGEKPKTI